MPINPSINTAFQAPQINGPLENALAAEQVKSARNKNALSEQSMADSQKPEIQLAQKQAIAKQIIADSLPQLNESNWNQFGAQMQKSFGDAGVFGQPYNPELHQELMVRFGVMDAPKQPEQLNELEKARAEYLKAMTGKTNRGMVGGGAPSVDSSGEIIDSPAPANLPVAALKMEVEAVDNANTAQKIVGDMDRFISQIDSGQLDLGMFANIKNRIRNRTGTGTQESANLQSFEAGLQKLRNDSLRLNKGPQTDGDAERAWQELLDNINDPLVVRQRLEEIKALNDNAARWHMEQANMVRANYGVPPRQRAGATQQNDMPVFSDTDRMAFEWAQSNPNDPRAQRIIDSINKKRAM